MVDLLDRSPQGLVDALCQRIEKLLVSYWPLPDEQEFKDHEPSPPRVHAQYLPVSKTESPERNKAKDFPLVQVVCMAGTVSDFSEVSNGSEINIHLYFYGYRKDSDFQGWRIPTSMLWRVLQDLLANTILAGYQLTAPIKWSPLNSENPPYFTAMMETVWKGCPPAVEVPQEGNLFGEQNNEEITFAENGES
ncbi:MAG: hypothetical protein LBG77_00915 [Dysgonamonadaceae bacterium]|jgi:hypothetical protein|nr:hypothetical protein [Dysgonamonadaceae bacterium]